MYRWDWEEDELLPAGRIVRKIGQGRMHEFNIFEQVDGKAGRKGRCCNLKGSKGLIGLKGGQVSAGRLDGEACLQR